MYDIVATRAYRKAYRRLSREKGFAIKELEKVVLLLLIGGRLPEKHRDHPLSGTFSGFRECHVLNDLLLIYYTVPKANTLVLADLGTHASLFS